MIKIKVEWEEDGAFFTPDWWDEFVKYWVNNESCTFQRTLDDFGARLSREYRTMYIVFEDDKDASMFLLRWCQ